MEAIAQGTGARTMLINPLKSLFSKKSTADGAQEQISPESPRYAYAFPSPYKRPRILVIVDKVSEAYFLHFHYILLRLHNTESLAFFVLESAEISQWIEQKSPAAFVEQVIADTQPTLVIFSQYKQPYADTLPALFKAQNAAIVCHICQLDDFQTVQNQSAAQNQIIEQADLIYAATSYIGDRLLDQFPNKTTFSAKLTPYLNFLISNEQPNSQDLKIGCAGDQTDQANLEAIAPEVAQILTDYPQAQFETFGGLAIPKTLAPFENRVTAREAPADYTDYLNQLQQLGWAIGLLPQQETEANRCKTPSQYLAYTACAIPTIASDRPVYSLFKDGEIKDGEKILLSQSDQWYDNIKQLIDNQTLRSTLVTNAQTYCQHHFSLETVEAQIKELIALAAL